MFCIDIWHETSQCETSQGETEKVRNILDSPITQRVTKIQGHQLQFYTWLGFDIL